MATLNLVSYEEFTSVVTGLRAEIESLKSQLPKHPQSFVLYSPIEAADYCRIKVTSLNRARRAGKLKGFKVNEKEYAYYQHDLDAYLKRYERAN